MHMHNLYMLIYMHMHATCTCTPMHTHARAHAHAGLPAHLQIMEAGKPRRAQEHVCINMLILQMALSAHQLFHATAGRGDHVVHVIAFSGGTIA